MTALFDSRSSSLVAASLRGEHPAEWKALGCLARHPSINEGKALALAHIPLNFSRRYEYDAYGKIFLSTDSKHHTCSSSLIRGLHGRSYY